MPRLLVRKGSNVASLFDGALSTHYLAQNSRSHQISRPRLTVCPRLIPTSPASKEKLLLPNRSRSWNHGLIRGGGVHRYKVTSQISPPPIIGTHTSTRLVNGEVPRHHVHHIIMAMDLPSKGTGGFSISLGSKKSTGGPTATAKKPTSGFSAFSKPGNKRGPALSDDEDDDGHEDEHRDKVQLVTGFGSKGAIMAEGEKEVKTLVIPALRNKDWRVESRKKKGIYLPPEATAQRDGVPVDTKDIIGDEPMKVGLQFVEKSTAGMTIAEGDVTMADAATQDAEGEEAAEKPEKTEDQLAMEALLAGDKAKASTLTIPAASENVADSRVFVQNEDDAYRADVASRPDAATLEEYAAVPVEEFGAALLRGMGWKEGGTIGKSGGAGNKPRIVEKRPAFLGIGAKGLGAEEIGAWGKGDKKGRQRVDKTYLPITLVDKDGKRVEEETGKEMVKKDVDKDWRSRDDRDRSDRRDRDYRDDKETSRSKRDRERYKDDDGGRDRRDRDKGRDRERSRDRRDRDKYRDKDSDRDYDRKHRSSEYDSRDRDRRRHRSRSRERSRR